MTVTDMTENRVKQTEEIFRLLSSVGRATRHFEPDAWLDLNLTIGQLKSLFFINNERSTNPSKLASALNVTPPNVTGIIDRLVEQGLVNREERPENRRMLILTVTEKGHTLLAGLHENNVRHLSKILSRLNDREIAALTTGLTALVREATEYKENSQ
jgi:MarR family transcriptional regulator, organic hydroperoxide resistance regulator